MKMILQLQQILHVVGLLELLLVVEGVGLALMVGEEGVEHEMLAENLQVFVL